jgi:hypothetical protein
MYRDRSPCIPDLDRDLILRHLVCRLRPRCMGNSTLHFRFNAAMAHIEGNCDHGVRPTRGSDRDLSGVHLTDWYTRRIPAFVPNATVEQFNLSGLRGLPPKPVCRWLLPCSPVPPASLPMYRSRLEQVSQERKQYWDPCERS